MSFLAPKPSAGREFLPPPAGTHAAICYRLIDLGTQETMQKGKLKLQRKILVSWELVDEKTPEGFPFTVHQRYTFNMSEKAYFRADIESWRGQAFTQEELEAFDIENLLGRACLVSIVHETKNGKTYANVKNVAKVPRTMTVPAQPFNQPFSFNLAEPNWDIFRDLSQSIQATIMKSPEYAEAMKTNVSNAPDETQGVEDTPF